jgi:hypothetical protein
MKRILFIALTLGLQTITLAQKPELVNKYYNFRVKQATQMIAKKWVGYNYDTITSIYSSIEIKPEKKEITIDYTDRDSENYKIKDKQSTFKNNRTFYCKYNGDWYMFTLVKLDNQTYHLNIESIKNKLSISFLLKEK